ncbi:hypothetical protein CSIM01_01071 [Colletotrichum simmondsii]|uniref:Uncharacterized protein n=1 Tax=Colletotrichum simmondsii TaxID=703756 RepID=A0A135S094_9PEZI|nr:hypothetical protein CSIM01_01071 [Colletotrichum simmondsii]
MRDNSGSSRWNRSQLLVNSSHLFSNATRSITVTRQVITIGPLRRPSIYASFTMTNFSQMAKAIDIKSTVDTRSVTEVNRNVPRNQHLKLSELSETGLSDTSSIEESRRSSPGPGLLSFSSTVTRLGTHEIQAELAPSNPLSPLDELPPRPSRPLFGHRSRNRTAGALLKPTRLFQLSISSQPEYDLGVAQQTRETSYGDYDNDSVITAVRNDDHIHHLIPSHVPRELYCSHAGFFSVSSVSAEAQEEYQRPELITEVIGEIDEFLSDLELEDCQKVLAWDYHERDFFIASQEPLPLQIPAKNKPIIHGSQHIYSNAEAKPLFTINLEVNNHGNGPSNQPTLPMALPLTKHNGFVDPSMVPAPLSVIKRSKADTSRKVKRPSTLRARSNKRPAGPRDIEHARRQQNRLRPDSPPPLGPLFDESAFGTPVIPFLPVVEPRQLLFPSSNSIAYLEHELSNGIDLDTDEIATVIEAPTGAAGVPQWDEEDSIDFLLGPIENAPPPVPPHRVLSQPQDPMLNRGVVLGWLEDSETVSGGQDATSHSEFDAPRPRHVRDVDASRNDEADTPCPLRAQDVNARVNAGIDALIYPNVQPENDFAYYEDDFLHEVMTAVSETQATDLDEQLRLLGPAYPSRILLWPLHHPTTESEPGNASQEGDERSQSTPVSTATEELPESPKLFL